MKLFLKFNFYILVAFMIIGCDPIKETYNLAFKTSFRMSFIQSCVDSSGKSELEPWCTCTADDLLTTYSTEELQNEVVIENYMENISTKECRALLNVE